MVDANKLCRICANMVYDEGIRMDECVEFTSLKQMLSYCTNSNLHDKTQDVLCIKCKNNLLIAYKLIVLYHKTSKRWKALNMSKKIELNVELNDVRPEQGEFHKLHLARTISTDKGSSATKKPVEQEIETTPKEPKTLFLRKACKAASVISANNNLCQNSTTAQVCTSCSTCGEKFISIRELQEHRRLACGMDDCIFKRWGNSRPKCCGCNADFDSLDLLRAHSRSVHRPEFESSDEPQVADRKHFICNICFRRYTSRSILFDHKQRPYRTKSYQCAHCGKSFRDKYSLDDHERVHRDERPFVCGICSKTFIMKESYRKHVRLHTFVPDRFKCEVCGKGFRTNGNLKEHQVTHTVVKSLQCLHCTSQFTRKSCLKSHMRLHTGEKPYTCELCNAIFTFASDLRRHVMAHNGIKPFICDVCSKAYPRKDYLAKHLTTAHPERTAVKPSFAKEALHGSQHSTIAIPTSSELKL